MFIGALLFLSKNWYNKKSMFSRWKNLLVVFITLEILAVGVSFAFNDNNYFINKPAIIASAIIPTAPAYIPPQKLSNPPAIIKAVYVTGYSAGTKTYLKYLTNLFKTTEINSVVIDIKDYSGTVFYKDGVIKDIDSLIRFFHDQNIYVIARIVVFEDPAFSKARPDLAVYNKIKTTNIAQPVLWQDNHGLSWLDPSSEDVWNYDISLAKDAFYHGFDEVNFDYVRFPSDGKTENMGFPVWDGLTPKSDIIKQFFTYTRQQLSGEKISVDLFGQTTVNTDDLGIGQIIENAFENFDYISPMVYPSHYANNFIGFANPAEHPYDVIKYSMASALSRQIAYSKLNNASLCWQS